MADGYATSCCKQPAKSRSHIRAARKPVELIGVPHPHADSSTQKLRHHHEHNLVRRSSLPRLHCIGRVDALLSRLRRGRLPRGRRLRLRSHGRHVRLLQGLRQRTWRRVRWLLESRRYLRRRTHLQTQPDILPTTRTVRVQQVNTQAMPNAATRFQHGQDSAVDIVMLHVTKTALHDVKPPHYIPQDTKSSI